MVRSSPKNVHLAPFMGENSYNMSWPKGKKRDPDSVARGMLSIEKSKNQRRDFPHLFLEGMEEVPHIPQIRNPREYYAALYGMVGRSEKSCAKVAATVMKKNLYPKEIKKEKETWAVNINHLLSSMSREHIRNMEKDKLDSSLDML